MIPEECIAEIRQRVDILELIGEYVRLKKRGVNHVGLCPFHDEKSPSFNVHGVRRFFHCFGCQASGDAIGFLMRLEGLSFPEAAGRLAERVGIELPETDSRQDDRSRRERERKERLYALMEAAADFYERQLWGHPARTSAHTELKRRGVAEATSRTFRLGFAPPGWDGLVQHLERRDWSLSDAESLGLIARRRDGDGYYDRFRNRLQFPVSDQAGRVVAFSGRILTGGPGGSELRPQPDAPKYVNSPEGPLYHKGSLLFGLHQARVAIRRLGWAVLCEGNFDLIALHQAGIEHVLAPLGTAFTEAQARAVARFAERVTLLFDGDAAGAKAVVAAHPLLAKAGVAARVAALPSGHDPDSFIRAQGQGAISELLDQAPGIVEYLIDSAVIGAHGASERARAVEGLGPVLAAVSNPVEIQLYIQRVGQRFEISDLGAVKRQLRKGALASRRRRTENAPDSGVVRPPEHVKLPKLQAELVGLLLDQPELFQSAEAKNLEELLTSPELQCIFRSAAELVRENTVVDASALLSRVESGGGSERASVWLRERLSVDTYQDKGEAQSLLSRGVERLAIENIQRELPRLAQEISLARRSGDDDLAVRLTRQRDELALSAHRLVARGQR
ncbi:MAG: DNA primase [Myxococcales bacterium]|nr:DNA primase [Myxococcales bacterium]